MNDIRRPIKFWTGIYANFTHLPYTPRAQTSPPHAPSAPR